ncbi:phosphatidylserine decarboxylase, partial [Conchiformibius steedae]|uniref:phosphatidylserine decarboxylase n=1 Tax=Conchiformibius steedae TaxID=153493 RepID=UPI0026F08FA2
MNRYYPHTIIAQEGWPFIIGGLLASVLMTLLCGWWSVPFWLFVLFCLQFFRDPARDIPDTPDAVLCPADGRIVVVEKSTDPYRHTEALKISVFMNVFNVHSQRAPAHGKITHVEYNAGKFLNAALDKASSENERNAVLMTTEQGHDITFVQVAGLVARRILCYAKAGESMVRGERYGFIRFGSRVDVYLPVDAVANVAIGDKVRASETILAYFAQDGEKGEGEGENTAAPKAAETSKAVAESRLKADMEAKAEAEKAARLAAEAEEKARLEA